MITDLYRTKEKMRDKLGRFIKGYGRFKKGDIPWNKGKHPEYVQGENHPMYGIHRFGEDAPHYNKSHSQKTKQIISTKLKGYKHSEETKKKMSMASKNKKISLITRIKISQSHKGNKSYSWKGGITPLNKTLKYSIEYVLWREKIFKRDNYTCQECLKKGNKLHPHHKKSFSIIMKEFLAKYSQFSPLEDKETLIRLAENYEPFWDIDNGITYCIQCHKQIHSNKNGNRFISI